MDRYKVIEKADRNAVHCLTWSIERARHWIKTNGNSGIFMDKSLRSDSFAILDSKTGKVAQ